VVAPGGPGGLEVYRKKEGQEITKNNDKNTNKKENQNKTK
jgi:hypothetical protein